MACLLLASPAFATDENNVSPAMPGTMQPVSEPDVVPASDISNDNATPASIKAPDNENTLPPVQIDISESTTQETTPAETTGTPTEAASADSTEINAFEVEGNTLVDSSTIQQHLHGLLGLKKNSTNLFKAKLAVFKLYRSSGLSPVVNLKVASDGTVLITISEGSIKTATALPANSVNESHKPSSETNAETPDNVTLTSEINDEAIQEAATAQDLEYEQPAIELAAPTEQAAARKEDASSDKLESQAHSSETIKEVKTPIQELAPQSERIPEQTNAAITAPEPAAIVKKSDPSNTQKPLPVPPAWLADGWQQLEAGNTAEAMAIWHQKVNKMHAYRYLSFIGVYMNQETAIRILKQAGLEYHALMLLTERNGKPAYYVLSALKTSYDKEQRQLELVSLRKKMGIDYMYASAAKRFQGQSTATPSPASEATVKSEPIIKPKAEKDSTPASKPALKKQIVKKEPRKATVKKPISPAPAKEPEPQVIEEVITSDGKITGFEIFGNSLISDKAIQRQLNAYLGDNKTASDLSQARDKITRLYQGRGYPVVAVSMPEEVIGEIIPVRIYEVSGTKKALGK